MDSSYSAILWISIRPAKDISVYIFQFQFQHESIYLVDWQCG